MCFFFRPQDWNASYNMTLCAYIDEECSPYSIFHYQKVCLVKCLFERRVDMCG